MKILLVSLTCLMAAYAAAVPHDHKVNKGHAARSEDGAYQPRDIHAEGFDHEAILGSAREAEEFDDLSPEEAKKRLAILVKRMDLNKDKFVSKVELTEWIKTSFKSLSREESRERFEDTDVNEDGVVTWLEHATEEYDLSALNRAEQEIEEMKSDPERADDIRMIEEDRILFISADANKDNELNADEYLSFSHPEEAPGMAETVVNMILAEKDKNGDGFIDFEEFLGARSLKHDKTWLDNEKDHFMEELDKNKDEKLDRAEIKDWMIPPFDDVADEEVTHLFEEADTNKDEKLSYDEIIEHHEQFVGSEATEYGEQLHNIHQFTDEL